MGSGTLRLIILMIMLTWVTISMYIDIGPVSSRFSLRKGVRWYLNNNNYDGYMIIFRSII